jgi:4-diphosphocytidyl-2-C-methyl-D-erythritol kinase
VDALVVQAHAKVNLGLEILGRRTDGYHDVMTVLQEVDLADTLTFADAPSVTLGCSRVDLAGETNLVLQAVSALQARAKTPAGVAIQIEKIIPVAAGLGGGSSDAAATLVGLNRFWELGLTDDQLTGLARSLGADVAFFLHGGTQVATGRGDQLEPLPTPALPMLLVTPPSQLADKTRRLYQALQPADFSDGSRTREVAEAIRAGRPLRPEILVNGFTRPALELFPKLTETIELLRALGAEPLLGGAGPTLLVVGKSRGELADLTKAIQRDVAELGGAEVRLVESRPARLGRLDADAAGRV